jgi:hypothetical protein
MTDQHGGKRTGAGRPPKPEGKVRKITIALYDGARLRFLEFAAQFNTQREAFEALLKRLDDNDDKTDGH